MYPFGVRAVKNGVVFCRLAADISKYEAVQIISADGSKIVEIIDLENPSWSAGKPFMSPSLTDGPDVRDHFNNGGPIMCEYAGIEYAAKVNFYPIPKDTLSVDGEGNPLLSVGELTLVDLFHNSMITKVMVLASSDLMVTLNYYLLLHFLNIGSDIQKSSSGLVTLH